MKKYFISAYCLTHLIAFSALASQLPPVATQAHGITKEMQEKIEYYRLNPPQKKTRSAPVTFDIQQAPEPQKKVEKKPHPTKIKTIEAPKSEEAPSEKPVDTAKKTRESENKALPSNKSIATTEETNKEDIPIAQRYLGDLKSSKTKNDPYVLDLNHAFDTLTPQYRSMKPKKRKQYLKAAEKEVEKLAKEPFNKDDPEELRRHINLITQYQLLKTINRETNLTKQKNIPLGVIRNKYLKNTKEHIDKLYQ